MTEVEELGVEETPFLNLTGLDEMERSEKLTLLDDAIHRLQFERRLAALTDYQLERMNSVDELNDHERQKIKNCNTEEERDELCTDYARTSYFRRSIWMDYLNGVNDECPAPEEEPESDEE